VFFLLALVCLFLIFSFSGCKIGNGDEEGNGNGNGNGNGETETISKWQLWSEGARLRGANIYQRRVYPELDGPTFMGAGAIGPPFTQADFDKLAQMGANYVNISHPGIFEEHPPFLLAQDVLANLENLVEMIGNADMFAVISFRTGPGRSEFTFFWGGGEDWFDDSYYNDTIWTNPGAQDAWIEMWQEVARRFKDNPYVVGYDLMVEPNANEIFFDIWNPFEFYINYGGTIYDWNQLYPRVSDAIREEDTDSPILIGAVGYSGVPWLPYLDVTGDERTVYMVHQYAPHMYTHQDVGVNLVYPGFMDADYDGENEYVDLSWLDARLDDVDDFIAGPGGGNAVVGSNEYGLVRWAPGAGAFMDDLMGLFEDRGMNYALWEWGPSFHQEYTDEVNAFNFRFGPDPDNTEDVETSDLLTVILKYWELNTHRPSNVSFESN
jgi:hypothetical protein